MTGGVAGLPLTEEDRLMLSRWTVGGRSAMAWLEDNPPAEKVHSTLVRVLDRGGPRSVFARVLAAHLGVDPVHVYAENWPRKAARLAADARTRGDRPHADQLHSALVALMFCANCGRPLDDPVSISRGIGPDCWGRIDPQWRHSISERIAASIPEVA